MAQNRRKHPRAKASGVGAYLRATGRTTRSLIENISAGGLFARSHQVLPVGTPVVVDLVVSSAKHALRLPGRVVAAVGPELASARSISPGMGVAFEALPEEAAVQLSMLLKELGSPALPRASITSDPSRPPEPATAAPADVDLKQKLEQRDREVLELRTALQNARSLLSLKEDELATERRAREELREALERERNVLERNLREQIQKLLLEIRRLK